MKIPSSVNVFGSTRLNGSSVPGISATPDSSAAERTHYGRRVRAYAERMETRLKNVLGSPDLTAEQRAAVEKLSEKFHTFVKRLVNAFLAGDGANANANTNVHAELERFEGSVNEVLTKGATPSSGSSGLWAGPQAGVDKLA